MNQIVQDLLAWFCGFVGVSFLYLCIVYWLLGKYRRWRAGKPASTADETVKNDPAQRN